MPPIAGSAGIDPTAMQALATGGSRGPATGGSPGPDQARAKTEAAVTQIREYSAQLAEIGKAIPGSEAIITAMQKQLRQLAIMAAQAGSVQNGSADALPS